MRAADRKAAIVGQARELARTRGISDTTYGDVAEGVGIARGLVYHYFPHRDDLFAAVLDQITAEVIDQFDEWDAQRSRGHVRGTAEEWVCLLRQILFPDPPLIADMEQPENVRFYVQLADQVVEGLADEFIRTTLGSYMRVYGPPVENLRSTCLVLLHGVVGMMRLHPDLEDAELGDIVYHSLHLKELTVEQLNNSFS